MSRFVSAPALPLGHTVSPSLLVLPLDASPFNNPSLFVAPISARLCVSAPLAAQ